MDFVVGDVVRQGFGFANPNHAAVEYDKRRQLVAVKEGGSDIERYVYDKAGNMIMKVVRGSRFVVRDGVECAVRDGEYKTTTFTFDDANQLVSSITDGITTRYEYDAAGRMIKEGDHTYTYGYLDKVMSVRFDRSSANSSTSQPLNSSTVYTYTYHPDGQLASANYGDSSESFTWDGLALIQRGNEHFINEPHVGGGNPVVSSKGTSYFNDALGTTVGAKSGKTYSAATLSAFGARELEKEVGVGERRKNLFFTGKPEVPGLGYAFLMRNYRASLGKWQTADPLGYPDGWNALAYCRNQSISHIDLFGCVDIDLLDEGYQSEESKNIRKGYSNYNPNDRITVGGHGDSGGDGICHSDGWVYSASEVAAEIRKKCGDKLSESGMYVEIEACYCGLRDWAQDLANDLRVDVKACTGKVRVFTDGTIKSITGRFVVFKPE